MTILPTPVNRAWWALRIAIGLGAFFAGLDKFFNLLTDWQMYLSPLAEKLLPFSPATFMHVVGVIEMIVGLAILSRWTLQASYVAAVWLVLIAANLLTTGMFFDLAVRDIEIAVAAFALGSITEYAKAAEGSEVRSRHELTSNYNSAHP